VLDFITSRLLSVYRSWDTFINTKCAMLDWLIGWCLTPTLALFQPYRGVNKCYINLKTHTRPFREIKHIINKQAGYMYT